MIDPNLGDVNQIADIFEQEIADLKVIQKKCQEFAYSISQKMKQIEIKTDRLESPEFLKDLEEKNRIYQKCKSGDKAFSSVLNEIEAFIRNPNTNDIHLWFKKLEQVEEIIYELKTLIDLCDK